MCIIIAKYKGNKLPKKEILENCFYNNNDGAGIAYTHNGRVYIDKGYNKFEEFYKHLKKLDKSYNLKNENVVLHFRIGTSGNMDARATHPFPISSSAKKLQAPKLSNLHIAVAHNGVIPAYAYKNNEGLSDTQNFIKDFLEPLQELNKNFYKNDKILQVIQKECASKLALIDSSSITLIGQFEKAIDGNYYSNGSYKADYYKAAYSKYYSSYNWSDYEPSAEGENWKAASSNDYDYYDYKNASELMVLNESYYLQFDKNESIENLEPARDWYAIDKNNTLYDIQDYYITANGTLKFILEPLADNVIVLDADAKPVQFEPNGEEWAVVD